MKNRIWKVLLSLTLALALIGCSTSTIDNSSSETTQTGDSNVMVAYFSKTGNTAEVAQEIQSLTGGTLIEIIPVDAYPDSYQETVDIARNELDTNARPEIQELNVNLDDYSTIFLGYPIWWQDAPMVIYTFLENNDLSGKTIIPFCTSVTSSIDESVEGIRQAASGATVLDGFTANNLENVQVWIESLDY